MAPRIIRWSSALPARFGIWGAHGLCGRAKCSKCRPRHTHCRASHHLHLLLPAYSQFYYEDSRPLSLGGLTLDACFAFFFFERHRFLLFARGHEASNFTTSLFWRYILPRARLVCPRSLPNITPILTYLRYSPFDGATGAPATPRRVIISPAV